MAQYNSPNGSPIIGTLEMVPGIALVSDIGENGWRNYSGETEMCWDDQKTVLRNGKAVFVDEDGGEWTFDQLVKVEECEEVE